MRQHENSSSSGAESFTESQRHELLANSVRRDALEELGRLDSPIALGDLAKAVLEGGERRHRRHVSSVQIELHHQHLPKLAEHGLIDYDESEKTVVENHVDAGVLSA